MDTKKTTKKKSANSTSKEEILTGFQQELATAISKINEYKLACEANVTAILWKHPDKFYDYKEIKIEDFSNNIWRVYWQIARDIILVENKQSLDEITVNLYLDKHKKLRTKYDSYEGFDTIRNAQKYVKVENLDGYVKEMHKWNAVVDMGKNGFPIADKISRFADMSLDEIYSENVAMINHIFINAETDIVAHDISDGIYDLIEKMDEGFMKGLEYNGLDLLTSETGGMMYGNVTLIGALSNVGKSTFVRSAILPSILKNDEKIVVMVNEEGLPKWQREMLIWVANNVYKKEMKKFMLRDGGFTKEVKELLYKCADYLAKYKDDSRILIVPLKSYSSKLAIKVINKYTALGFNHFILDTFKASKGVRFDQMWQAMQMEMVDIYDNVKEESNNVHLTATFQLSKSSTKQRYYTLDNVGMAKNIVDVASTGLMIRNFMDDEKTGGGNELKVFKYGGVNKKTKVPVKLDNDKNYQIIFIVKNREGSANQQIVVEHDLSKNILREVGYTVVPQDF